MLESLAGPNHESVLLGVGPQLGAIGGTFIDAIACTMNARGNMPMGDLVKTAVGDAFKATTRIWVDKNYDRGFSEATSACVEVLTDARDGLRTKLESGGKLSAQEQALYALLTELKAEMEERLNAAYEPPSARLNLP
ncbi:hypothetical protein ACIRD2_21950 [Streptomyces sp. NPDC093595]|uniref:hypothetical protein n=1 Tax=Streptomyces sp. NPDC093595 TaxID=3366045 RepID=UPI003801EA67